MNCKEVESFLSEFCDRELNQEKGEALEKHLMGCSECRNEYESLNKIKRVLKRLKEYEIPRDYLESIKNAKKGKTSSAHKKPSNL